MKVEFGRHRESSERAYNILRPEAGFPEIFCLFAHPLLNLAIMSSGCKPLLSPHFPLLLDFISFYNSSDFSSPFFLLLLLLLLLLLSFFPTISRVILTRYFIFLCPPFYDFHCSCKLVSFIVCIWIVG